MRHFRREFPEVVIGFSSHHNGISMELVAHLLGARIFEKHFTLNRTWKGTDQSFSLTPEGMRRMVRDLRRVPAALGSSEKHKLDVEKKPLQKMGKSLVAARDLRAGSVLKESDLTVRSPGGGLAPYNLEKLVGRAISDDIEADSYVTFDNLET